MLINAAIEAARRLRLSNRLLARRARAAKPRRPLVVVPPCFGTRLLDQRGDLLWGSTRRLFFGTNFAIAGPGRVAGMLDGFPVVPGVYRHDVLGGLIRFLERVGGYVRGEDLQILLYDFRLGIPEAAGELGDLIDRVRGFGDEKVDLVAISSGGIIARYLLASESAKVRRVVYLGVPQRGTFSAFAYLQDGFEFVRGGKHFEARELHHCRALWQALPHPDDRIFIDPGGAPIDCSIYDPDTWGRLGLLAARFGRLAEYLERAERVHRTLDAAPPHPDAFAIAGRHLPTPTRAIVDRGRVTIPCQHCPQEADAIGFGPGDGAVPERTLAAVPGMNPEHMWWVEPPAHHVIATWPRVHPVVLEALLAPERAIPSALYRLGKRPATTERPGAAAATGSRGRSTPTHTPGSIETD